jgi:hypothetical protein
MEMTVARLEGADRYLEIRLYDRAVDHLAAAGAPFQQEGDQRAAAQARHSAGFQKCLSFHE